MNTEPLMSCPFCGAAEDDLHVIDQARAAQLWNGSALHSLGRVRIPAEGAVMLTRAGRVAA